MLDRPHADEKFAFGVDDRTPSVHDTSVIQHRNVAILPVDLVGAGLGYFCQLGNFIPRYIRAICQPVTWWLIIMRRPQNRVGKTRLTRKI